MNRDNSYMQTPEFREAQRQGHLRHYAKYPMAEETKAKIGRSNKGKVRPPEWCKHISESKTGKSSSKRGKPQPSSSYKRSEETKRRMSEGRKRMLAEHPELLENLSRKLTNNTKLISSLTNRYISRETREKQAKTRQRYFAEHPGAGRAHGEIMKQLWTKPSYIEAVVKARNIKPNKQEIALGKIIDEVCPQEFKYNGDYSLGVVLNRFIPDFVNINGKKQVIEFFGSYWHRAEGRGEQEMKARYRQLGWDCLVVWDTELRQIDALKDKIRVFGGLPSIN